MEKKADKQFSICDIFEKDRMNVLYILCYSVNTHAKYPFLQFMLEKTPQGTNMIKEQFILPYVIFTDTSKTIEELVVEKTQQSLQMIQCRGDQVTNNMFKGVIFDKRDIPYAMINITGIDIDGLYLSRDTSIWFGLPSEMINDKHICGIPMDDDIVYLFSSMLSLNILHEKKDGDDSSRMIDYIIPEVVYTGAEYKKVEFNAVFGNTRQTVYKDCNDYYYFYYSLQEAFKEGGWVREGGTRKIDTNHRIYTHSANNRLLIDNEYGRFIKGGINRYALFMEGLNHVDIRDEFSLTQKDLDTHYPEPCLRFIYDGPHEIKPDVLVKDYDRFCSLSYHPINKTLLGDKYDVNKNSRYMIQ